MSNTPPEVENLVLLLTQHQDALFRYIYSLVTREADARDILQETSVALFRKWDQYDTARPFLPWAYRFAYFQVQKLREKSARSPLACCLMYGYPKCQNVLTFGYGPSNQSTFCYHATGRGIEPRCRSIHC